MHKHYNKHKRTLQETGILFQYSSLFLCLCYFIYKFGLHLDFTFYKTGKLYLATQCLSFYVFYLEYPNFYRARGMVNVVQSPKDRFL